MKSINIKSIIALGLCLATFGFFSSCSDDPKNVGLDFEQVEDDNNPAYQEYLANLREYRKKDHKILYGQFDNSRKYLPSYGAHIKSVPDSVDIVSLLQPDNLTDLEMKEMKILQEKRGTKVILTIDSEDAVFRFETQIKEEFVPEEGQTPSEIEDAKAALLDKYLGEFIDSQVALIAKYNYDGLSLYYKGLSTESLTPAGVEKMRERQNLIFGKLNPILNSDKLFIFEGNPKNVLPEVALAPGETAPHRLANCDYIVIRTEKLAALAEVQKTIEISMPADLPTDNILIAAIALSTKKDEPKVGMIFDYDGTDTNMVEAMAYWEPQGYEKAGLAVMRINDDYYNSDLDYKFTREAMRIMNPSPKY